MRAGYVVSVVGLSLSFVWVACSDDTSSNPTGGSGGGSTTTTTGASGSSSGGSGGTGGSATGGSGGSATGGSSTGGSAGSAGSGGTTGGSGGGTADASTEATGGCQSACDCSDGVGCFNGECKSDLSAVYCCGSSVCNMAVFANALCQRADKSYSRCGGIPDAGGKDGSVSDICPFFSCASGQACPPGCTKCDNTDTCGK